MNDPPAKGGKIPGFKTFKFKPFSFEGFKFDNTEFVGFEFEGFDQSQNLAFKEVKEIKTEVAKGGTYAHACGPSYVAGLSSPLPA